MVLVLVQQVQIQYSVQSHLLAEVEVKVVMYHLVIQQLLKQEAQAAAEVQVHHLEGQVLAVQEIHHQ